MMSCLSEYVHRSGQLTGSCTKLAFSKDAPLSVVLFLIVCNLLLDLLKTKKDLGYQLKNADFKQTQKTYADDLTIITGSVDGCKELLHLVETF